MAREDHKMVQLVQDHMDLSNVKILTLQDQLDQYQIFLDSLEKRYLTSFQHNDTLLGSFDRQGAS